MRWPSRLIRSLLALLAGITVSGTTTSAQSTVEGTITYDDRAVAMTHVSARETRPGPSTSNPPQVKILIADRTPPAALATSEQAYIAAARQGEIQGLILTLDGPGDDPRLILFAPGVYESTFVPDVFEQVTLTDLVRENGWVSGRLRTSEPVEFDYDDRSDLAVRDRPLVYALDLRFRARIAPAPAPTETLTGEAARRSPQAAAALRYLTLFRTGTPAEIRASLHPDHPAWEDLGSAQGTAILEAVRGMLPEPAAFARSIERVTVYGDEAVIVGRDGEGSTTVSLRRVDGEWKAAREPIPND